MKNGSAAQSLKQVFLYIPPLLGDVPPPTDSSKDKKECEWNRMRKGMRINI
jgi:hypothetical protein